MIYYRIFKFELLGWKFIMKILQRGHTLSIFCSLLTIFEKPFFDDTYSELNMNTNAQSSRYHV